MNMKVLFAALAASVASFLLGWLVFGMLLDPYYKANMIPHAGLMKLPENMNMLAIIISNLAGGCLLAWVLSRMGVASAMGGLLPGAVIASLMALSFDMMMYAMMNLFASKVVVIVDVVANAAVGGVVGAIAGLVLGWGGKAKTA